MYCWLNCQRQSKETKFKLCNKLNIKHMKKQEKKPIEIKDVKKAIEKKLIDNNVSKEWIKSHLIITTLKP
jgi:hypothetical protein